MTDYDATRRDFLKASASGGAGAWLALQWPALLAAARTASAAQAAGTFAHLSVEEARDLEAVAAQIIPSDETPGAREAGVIYFIDAALGSFMSANAGVLREGLTALTARVHARHPQAASFAALDDAAQIGLLQAEEATPFFQTVAFLTHCGMFALPTHGGNRDEIGWKLLGFDHRHVWAPPFGYYDAHAAQGESDGKG